MEHKLAPTILSKTIDIDNTSSIVDSLTLLPNYTQPPKDISPCNTPINTPSNTPTDDTITMSNIIPNFVSDIGPLETTLTNTKEEKPDEPIEIKTKKADDYVSDACVYNISNSKCIFIGFLGFLLGIFSPYGTLNMLGIIFGIHYNKALDLVDKENINAIINYKNKFYPALFIGITLVNINYIYFTLFSLLGMFSHQYIHNNKIIIDNMKTCVLFRKLSNIGNEKKNK
jgi:hypothetical protein